jgi:hypothetical protein
VAAIGIAVVGAVFFPQLKADVGYGHAFMVGVWLSSRCSQPQRRSRCFCRGESRPTRIGRTS